MAGYLQLAHLATLALSSACEIAVTRVVRHIQHTSIHYGDAWIVSSNEKWTKAVIRSALEVDDRWSLDALPWLDFGFFPPRPAFKTLCNLLPLLRSGAVLSEWDDIRTKMTTNITNSLELSLAERMATEIWEVCAKG